MPALRKLYPETVYVVIGDGDGRAELESLASERQLEPYVRFLGRLSDEELLAFYRSSSVFIMPSTKEGFGIVFAEAAATGLWSSGETKTAASMPLPTAASAA